MARPISNPNIDLQEPLAILLVDEITMVGLRNFSLILLAIIPINPSCQNLLATNIKEEKKLRYQNSNGCC